MASMELPGRAAEIYDRIRKRYKVGFESLKVGDRELKILQVEDLEPLLAGKDPFKDPSDFPFWVKLWEASMVLANVVVSLPAGKPGTTLLELGAGLAAPGFTAAAMGYDVTLSDYEPIILDFERVTAAANGFTGVKFELIDWLKPPDLEPFDTIIGAEILFRDDFFEPLLKIFGKLLKPGGTIYLAHDMRRKSLPKFLTLAEKEYEIAFSTRRLLSDEGDELNVVVNRLRRR